MIKRPFFSFYGSKFRIAPRYPKPAQGRIIEPFAGSAGYSLRYYWLPVYLYDVDPIISGVWDFLIKSSAQDILSLPLIRPGELVSDLPICQEAQWLIGFWLARGRQSPAYMLSAWGSTLKYPNHFWSTSTREMVANQVQYIKHWKVSNKPYRAISPSNTATWFIDPPYSGKAGNSYVHKFSAFSHLADWVQSLSGQKIVCEQEGATWLPFSFLVETPGTKGVGRNTHTSECVWVG